MKAGDAWLIGPVAKPAPRALIFATGLAVNPGQHMVVVDLPVKADPDSLEAVANQCPQDGKPICFVFGKQPLMDGDTKAGPWLAARLGIPVTLSEGHTVCSPHGRLFVGQDRGRGFITYAPDGTAERVRRRLPTPAWESFLPPEPCLLSPDFTVEQIPGGLWIRPAAESDETQQFRRRLTSEFSAPLHILAVVLGAPHQPVVPKEDLMLFRSWVSDQLMRITRFYDSSLARVDLAGKV
ncbi:hypothetical protein [Streptomyces sp. NPDC090080]|uniref:hypothetical protein n=1 Tax=Streptomyces sp. NPDC090080 TaxID=3365939 RepID=UPI003800B435